MKEKLKQIRQAYGELFGEIWEKAPIMLVLTFAASVVAGIMTPLSVFVNSHIFNDGIKVAQKQMTFGEYAPWLALFVVIAILPSFLKDIFIFGYVESKSQLILRTALKGRMLQKIKKMKYEHFERKESVEIIQKAYYRTENAARHMFPMYIYTFVSNLIASAGLLFVLLQIKWWLLFTVLLPFALQTYFTSRNNFNIYKELEKYWEKEQFYEKLGEFLKTKEYLKENKLNGASDYLIDTYRARMNSRNREYESYYFKQLRRNLAQNNITKLAILMNVFLLLFLFVTGEMSVGLFISASLAMFTQIFQTLDGTTHFIRFSGFHINTFDYYNKYFALSEEEDVQEKREESSLQESVSIEFRNVWFRYPDTERDILKGLSFRVNKGEKISVVGENGEGKSTMIKLLLGLFTPDKGEILLNDKPLLSYTAEERSHIFGTVFQDFIRYSIPVRENVEIGNIGHTDEEALRKTLEKARAKEFIEKLPQGMDTLLGRDFEGGIDLSGGQWQRIAIARALIGEKPVLVLDEPTSQLDPIAESNLYQEFAEMAEGKTAIFITHRLASTMITDRIFVISGGMVTESGTHEELMRRGGLYAQMFEVQKQWYKKTAYAEQHCPGGESV